jgi:hypothetical protein
MELEADKFAGFILYKLGASIEETKKAYSSLSERGSSTHPPRSARIAAISSGYYDAKRNGELIEPIYNAINRENTTRTSENTSNQNNTQTRKKKDNGTWFIYHRMCSENGKFWVTEGQETAFCNACGQQYHLRWSGGIDVITGKPYVLDYMETTASSTSRMLREQNW